MTQPIIEIMANTTKPKRDYKATAVRLPPDVHKAVLEAAAREERTFNGQVVATLRAALLPQSQPQGAAK